MANIGGNDLTVVLAFELAAAFVLLAATVWSIAFPLQRLWLPKELYKSLTWDRGKELADHPRLTMATDVEVYFCDPQSPWQRGSNENTNRLLRQYFPKGTDLSRFTQAQLSKVARELNERLRKTLAFETPAERFNAMCCGDQLNPPGKANIHRQRSPQFVIRVRPYEKSHALRGRGGY